MKKPSTDHESVQQALNRLWVLLQREDAEFPDVAWNVASTYSVEYEALVDAYDQRCRGE